MKHYKSVWIIKSSVTLKIKNQWKLKKEFIKVMHWKHLKMHNGFVVGIEVFESFVRDCCCYGKKKLLAAI
jgi:hypothetical protein